MNWLTKNYVVIIVTALLVLAVVLAIYFKGRKDGATGFLSNLLGGDEIQVVSDYPGGFSDLEEVVKNVSERINKYSNGWNPFHSDDMCAAYEDALGLPDPSFITLIKYYKETYKKHLHEEVTETWANCVNVTPNGGDYKQQMLDRITQLSINFI